MFLAKNLYMGRTSQILAERRTRNRTEPPGVHRLPRGRSCLHLLIAGDVLVSELWQSQKKKEIEKKVSINIYIYISIFKQTYISPLDIGDWRSFLWI